MLIFSCKNDKSKLTQYVYLYIKSSPYVGQKHIYVECYLQNAAKPEKYIWLNELHFKVTNHRCLTLTQPAKHQPRWTAPARLPFVPTASARPSERAPYQLTTFISALLVFCLYEFYMKFKIKIDFNVVKRNKY